MAGDVAFHHEIVTRSGDASSDDGTGRGVPGKINDVGCGSVGLGKETDVATRCSPLVGGNDSGDVRGDQSSSLEVAEEIDRSSGNDDGLAGCDHAESETGGGEFGGARREEAAFARRTSCVGGLEAIVGFAGDRRGNGIFAE